MNYPTFKASLLDEVNSFLSELDAVYEDQDMHLNNKVANFIGIGERYGIPLNEVTL